MKTLTVPDSEQYFVSSGKDKSSSVKLWTMQSLLSTTSVLPTQEYKHKSVFAVELLDQVQQLVTCDGSIFVSGGGEAFCVCVCTCVCMYVCTCVHVCMYMCVCMYMRVCTCVYVHVCMYMCVCVYVHVCMYMCVCTCMYMCVSHMLTFHYMVPAGVGHSDCLLFAAV